MKRIDLKPIETVSVPIFEDAEGNQYIAIGSPENMREDLGTTIYQPITMNPEQGVLHWDGVTVELYATAYHDNRVALHLDPNKILLGMQVSLITEA